MALQLSYNGKFKQKTDDPFVVIGPSKKPEGCLGCSYRSIGKGFVPDERPEKPRIALLLEAPGENEALQSKPLIGAAGQMWIKRLIKHNKHEREDCLICNTIRCNPPRNEYPTGKLRVDAEQHCRAYDDKIREFDPNLFIVTIHPGMLLRASAMMRLVQRDLRFAFERADEQTRPLVLMGDTAMNLVAPWLKGGVKRWRGHWWLWKYGTKFETLVSI